MGVRGGEEGGSGGRRGEGEVEEVIYYGRLCLRESVRLWEVNSCVGGGGVLDYGGGIGCKL